MKKMCWSKHVRRCRVVVNMQDFISGGCEFEYRSVHSTVLCSLTML